MTAGSLVLIGAASVVELLVFSPDGDPLGTVDISKAEAARLVSLPCMMGHIFRAAREADGRVFVEPVEWEVQQCAKTGDSS